MERIKGAQSRLNGLKSLAKLFNFVVCNPCQSSPSLTILVPLWFIIISLMFFYFCKVLFSDFLQFNGNFVDAQNNSEYRDWAPLTRITNDELWLNLSRLSSSSQYQVIFLFFYCRQSSHDFRGEGSFLTTDLEQLLRDCRRRFLEESYFGAFCSGNVCFKKDDFARVTSASLKPPVGILERKDEKFQFLLWIGNKLAFRVVIIVNMELPLNIWVFINSYDNASFIKPIHSIKHIDDPP